MTTHKSLALLTLASMTAALSGCLSPDQGAILNAERAVSASLKDPDSAKFLSSFVVRGQIDKNGFQDVAVCGVVDGKNSYAALTGGARFIVAQTIGYKIKTFDTLGVQLEPPDRDATVLSMDTEEKETIFEAVYWNQRCVDAAHPPSYTGVRVH